MSSSLGEAVVEVGADTSGFQKDVEDGVDKSAKKAAKSLSQIGKGFQAAGAKLTLGITTPLTLVAKNAIQTQATFEQSMNLIEANTGAGADAMARMEKQAVSLGKSTVFSANDAADAMLELAKGGFKPAEIAGGAAASAINLAATEGLALADSATIIGNAMNTFGLAAKDSTQIADALAAGSSASSASVASLAEGLGNVGPIAKQTGLSLQDVVAALAEFDQAGIKGAEGGTALRSFLTRLVPQGKKAKNAMRDLGIEFTKQDGSFKSLGEIAGVLQKKIGKLTDAQKAEKLQTIFGTYAKQAAAVLLKGGTKTYEKYAKAVDKSGTAQKLADARMKGTAGAIERMNGSIETASLALGQAMAPAVTNVANVVGDLAGEFSDLDPAMRGTVLILGAAAAAAGPLLIVTGSLIRAYGTLKTATIGASTSLKVLVSSEAAAAAGTTRLNASMAMLGKTAQVAAGVGGMAAMAYSTQTTDEKMKVLTATAGAAAAGFAVGGPLGAAVGGVAGLFGTMATRGGDATGAIRKMNEAAEGGRGAQLKLRDALNQTTGAMTKQARQAVAQDIFNQRLGGSLHTLGISNQDLVSAVLGQEGAYKRVSAAVQRFQNVGGANATAQQNALSDAAVNIGAYLGGANKKFRQTKNEIQAVSEGTRTWNEKLSKLPKDVRVAFKQSGYDVGIKNLKALNRQIGLTPKQVTVLLKANNSKITEKEIKKVQDALFKAGKQKADTKPFEQSITKGTTNAKGQATKGSTAVGAALKAGAIAGMAGMGPAMAAQMSAAVNQAIAAGRKAADAHSPSKKTERLGKDMGDGLNKGMKEKQKAAKQAGEDLIKSTLRGMLDAAKHGQAVSKASLKQMDKLIQKAGLGKGMKGQSKRLTTQTLRFNAITKDLDVAQKKLDQISGTYTAVRDAVLNQVDPGSLKSFDQILGKMTKAAADAKAFDSVISQLRDAKLDKSIIDNLLNAGPAALQAAQSILASGSTGIKELNSLQGSLNASSKSLGNQATQNMYGVGYDATAGLVKGLKAGQAKVEKQMNAIAQAMIKSIKKALGIKSPSTVFEAQADYSIKGYERGLDKGKGRLNRKVGDLVQMPKQRDSSASLNALAAAISGSKGNDVDLNIVLPDGDPEAAAMVMMNRLAQVGVF